MRLLDRLAEYLSVLNKKMRRWRRVISVMAAIVVFVTTYALVLPAITLDVDTASIQSGIEVATENEAAAAGTVFESTEEEMPEAEPAEEEEPEAEPEAEPAVEEEEAEAAEEVSEAEPAEEEPAEEAENTDAEEPASEEEDSADEAAPVSSDNEDARSENADSISGDEAPSKEEAASAAPEAESAETAKTVVTEDTPLITEKTQLTYKGKDYVVYADFDGSAKLPVGVELKVREITKEDDPETYKVYYDKALEGLKDKYDENTGLSFARFYDIAFVFEGQEIEPKGNVAIKIEYKEAVEIKEETKIDAIHFDKEDDEKAEIIDSEKEVKEDKDTTKVESVGFESDKFSVYGVVGAETFTAQYLTEDGETYNISVTAGAEAHIPSDAKLEISEVKEGSDKYDELFAKAEAAVTDGKDASVPYARFFDIAIVSKDGEKIQPDAPVEVKITFDETVEAEKNAVFNAVHIADDDADAEVIDVTTEGDETDEAVTVEAVKFAAEGFSYYGITYTVDFEYTDPITGETYYYSLNGEGSINLTDLLVILDIKGEDEVEQFVAEEVEDVKFSDPELVKVTHEGKTLGIFGTEDWVLESLAPFETEETLTISLKDGGVITVIVKDLQYTTSLNDVLTDLTISGAEWDAANNQYVVKAGKKYGVTMTFQEGEAAGEYQFSNTDEMTLTLPAGITFEPNGATFPIYVNEAGNNYTINGNQLVADGNSIKVILNTNDENYQKLKDLTTATFTVNVTGVFNSDESGYTIDGKTDTDITVDTSNDVTIQKSGSVTDWNSDTNFATVTYTLRVISNGTNNNVIINDTISGETISYNGDATVVKEGGGSVQGWTGPTTTGNGFTVTSGEMQDGEVYLVTYTAKIDKSKLNPETGAFELGDNRNTVTWDGGHPTPYDVNHTVSTGLRKTAGNVTIDGSNRTIPWTITAYSDFGTNNQLHTITDTIKTEGMHYSGTQLHVVVYNNDVYPPTIAKETYLNWSDVGVNDLSSATGFELDVIDKLGDNTGKKYKYEISYETTYNASNLTQNTNVKNDVEDDHDNYYPGSVGIEPNPENKMDLSKTMENTVTDDQGRIIVTWRINVTVPKAGLTAAQAVLVDNLPKATSGNTSFQDTYVADSFRVISGLQGAENAVINVAESTDSKVVINFTRNGTDLGLNESSAQRTIVLELQTLCDPDWITDENSGVTRTHTNEAIFNNIHRYASYTPPETRFEKTGSQDGKDENGLPKFTYNLLVGVISDELFESNSDFVKTDGTGKYIELVDTFDARLSYIDGSAKVYGGDNKDNVTGWETALAGSNIISDPTNHKVTFRLYQDQLPRNNNKLCSYYKVVYQLAVKDQETFEQLQNEAMSAETHKVTLGNTAEGFGDVEFNIEYEPNVLDKSHKVENGKLIFTITVNEDRLTLSDNGVLVLTDTMTNLSVRYQDVSVAVEGNKTVETTDAEGNPVTAPYFNMKGDTITFYIPDGVKTTITYAATPRGEVGADGNIHYSNTAKLQGFEKTDSGEKKYESEASGYGTNYGVNLYKADALVNSNALDGAVFKLFEADEEDGEGNIISGSPVKNADGSDYTVTTSDGRDGSPKGTVLVMGTDALGWNLKPEKRYYLLEVVAPEGYALDNTKYSFVISKDGYVNYTKYPVVAPDGSGKIVQPWTYHNGDVLTVKDWHKDGVLTLSKSFNGLNTAEPDDDQKAAISFRVYRWNDSAEEFELFRTIAFDQLTKNSDGKYSYTIGDLQEGKYKVVEIVNDVTCRQTTYEIVDTDEGAAPHNESENREERYATIVISEEDVANNTENEVNITNDYNVPSEFKIYKYGSPANIEGEISHKLAKAKFSVYATDDDQEITGEAIETFETDSRGKFTILMDAEKYSYDRLYAVVETEAPEGFELNTEPHYFYFLSEDRTEQSGLPDGTVQISYLAAKTENIPDTPVTTYIEARKIWLNDMLEEETDNETPVQVRIRQIASYDKAGTVIEEALSGYYSATSDEPVTQQRATTFKIAKVDGQWQLTTDTVEDPKLVDGKLTDLPTMTIDNHIPIYYSYEVEEVETEETAGYVATYEYQKLEDGGTSATVTNKPDSITSITRVKAKKKWVNISGQDITDKMGIDDGITVKVYRTSGLITRGTIYDGSVSRDPSQQFVMTFTDDTHHGVLNTSTMVFLPGDKVRITIKPLVYPNSFSQLGIPNLRSNWDEFKTGDDYKEIIDTENEQFIYEFTSRFDTNNKDIHINQVPQVVRFEAIIENVDAEGRIHVLSHADLEGITDKTEVEELTLNKANGWSSVSKEYPTADRNGNVYSYFVVENNGENYGAEYTISNDAITVKNIDKKLEVDKKWLAPNGDDITNSKTEGSILYTIKRNAYATPIPEAATIDYSDLKLTFDSSTVVVNPSNVSIPDGIKVGSTIKIRFRLPDDHSNAENSPMNGLETIGGEIISDSGAYNVSNNGHIHAEREFTFLVTEQTLKLFGTLTADRNAASGLNIDVTILKEPDPTYIPDEEDVPVSQGESIGTVEVGYDSVISYDFGDNTDISVSVGTTPWSAVINKLPDIDAENGLTYTYYIEEATAIDFDLVSITPSQGAPLGGTVQVVNKLKPGSLSITKIVEGTDAKGTYTIGVQDSEGNYFGSDGTSYGSTPHYETFAKDEIKTWTNLIPGNYTVLERDASVEDYTWTVTGTGAVKVNMGETTEKEVINSYFKNAEYTPSITKALKLGDEDVTPWPDGISFDFYLSFVSGTDGNTQLSRSDIVMNNREATATEANKTAEFNLKIKDPDTQEEQTLPGIEFKKPGTYIFTIEEVEPAGTQDHKKNGIVYSQDKVTLTVVVGEKEGQSGVLEFKSSTYDIPDPTADAGLITNSPDYPTYAPSVTKKLTENGQDVDETIWAEKSFTFDLAFGSEMTDEQKANVVMPSAISKTVNGNSEDHKETFGALAFKAAGTYTFTVTEQQGTDSTVSYNTTPKSIQVTVEPDADNNLNVTKVTIDGTEITGESIVGSGVTVENIFTREKEFKFKKIWLDDNTATATSVDWQEPITVELYGKETGKEDVKISDYEVTVPAPEGAAYSVELKTETIGGKTYKSYEFTLPKLDAKYDSFYVKEKDVAGYHTAYRIVQNGDQEGILIFQPDQGKDHADEGDYIVNSLIKVELPESGGPGSKLFYGIGLSFIAMAGLLLFIKRNWKGIDPL